MFLVVGVPMAGGKGFVVQPSLHIDTLGRRVEEAEVEQLGRIDGALGDRDQRGAWIERLQSGFERPPPHRLGEIGLGQQQAIGHRRLLDRLGLPVERGGTADQVHGRYHTIEYVAGGNDRLGHQCVQDRCRIGKASGLNHDAGEPRDFVLSPVHEEARQGVDDVVTHRAAQAAAVEQHDVLARPLDQEMVQTDLAKFVDDDRRCRHAGLLQDVVEHGRLAAAEKTGQQGCGDQRRWFCRAHS